MPVTDVEKKSWWQKVDVMDKNWWKSLHIPIPYIPKVYTILKWSFLVIIAVTTALVGFFQSMLVSWVYMFRSKYFIYNVIKENLDWRLKLLEYVGVNALLALACTATLYFISPAAAGSGIPDVKAYLNGVESPAFKSFFTVKTFIAKVLASALGVSSGMAMGKEGPMLHAGSIVAVVMGSNKWMQQQMQAASRWGVYTYNKELRDLVSIGVACGVTTAFKAPVGGVLFAMEISSRWRKDLTWRCFLAAAITVVVVRSAIILCKGHGKCSELKYGSLIFFQSDFPAHFEQVWAVSILAVVGGYVACLFTSFNTWVCLVRKKWSKKFWARMTEVVVISIFTSIILYVLPSAGNCMQCTILGDAGTVNCILGNTGAEFHTFNSYHCTKKSDSADWYNDLAVLVFNPQGFKLQALFTAPSNYANNGADSFTISSLLLYGGVYWFLAAVTYGAFIPSGLFTPSMIMGSCLGRAFAEILIRMGVPNVDVGMYALMGCGAFIGGLMRMSAAMALILMEMTLSPQQLPFLMMVLVLSKQVGDQFNYGVFEHQMMVKGLAFVGIDDMPGVKQKTEKIMARDVMTQNNRSRTLYCVESGDVLEKALEVNPDLGAFPVTTIPAEEGTPGDFLGMISRANVTALLEEHGAEDEAIDLSRKVEVAPIIIPPNMPLPFIYRVVQTEGFNYVPVIRYHGPLEGIVSRQELVDVQNNKLDEYHLKATIDQMTDDIEHGKIIGSMHLGDNIHATRMKEGMKKVTEGTVNFLKNPLKATKDGFLATKEYIQTDDREEKAEEEFFLTDVQGPSKPHISQSGDIEAPSAQNGVARSSVPSRASGNGWRASAVDEAANTGADLHGASRSGRASVGQLSTTATSAAEMESASLEEGTPLLGGQEHAGDVEMPTVTSSGVTENESSPLLGGSATAAPLGASSEISESEKLPLMSTQRHPSA